MRKGLLGPQVAEDEMMEAPEGTPAEENSPEEKAEGETPQQERTEQMSGDADADEAGGDQGYEQAMAMAMSALYQAGAAKDAARAVKAAASISEGLANVSYELVMAVDEKSGGAVPDEQLVAFASEVLGEVAEICQAAGAKITSQDIAVAMRDMLLRYLGENGVDAGQLSQAMQGIDMNEVGSVMDKVAGQQQGA